MAAPGSDPALTAATSTTTASLRQYTYDAAGRVTADGVHSYTWNAADQIVQIAGVATYA
ncbi:MAG: hypothetical protein KGJ55_09240 [Gammaproteobacteria bacterium]|nr:hypothetical protein [Gammaproteobacteria bacterium]